MYGNTSERGEINKGIVNVLQSQHTGVHMGICVIRALLLYIQYI